MKRTFKKTISLVLAVIMVFAALPLVGATAICETCNYTYEVAGKGWHKYTCTVCGTLGYGVCKGGTATCSKGAICDECKNEYTDPSGQHVVADYTVTEAKYLKSPATCNSSAVYYYSCTVCEEPVKDDAHTFKSGKVDPNNHVYGLAVSNDNGTHDLTCIVANCGAQKKNVACSDAEPVLEGVTCTTGGNKVSTCDDCGYVWRESVAATGHDYSVKSGVKRSEATCTAFDTYWYKCSKCNTNAKNDTNAKDKYYNGTSKLGHVYDQKVQNENTIVVSATCQQEATYYYSCKCGANGTATFKGAKGTHTWDAGIYNNDAKCGVNGTKKVTCVINGCGATDVVEAPGTALNHDFSDRVQKADRVRSDSSCLVYNTYWYTCTRCPDVWSDSKFFTGTIKGECNADGVDINENNYFLHNKVPATCTELAIFYKYCTVCGASSRGKANEATFSYGSKLPHTYGEKIEDKYIRVQATCDTGAIYSKSCAVCGVAKIADNVDVRDPNANVSTADIFYGSPLGHDLKVSKAYKDSTCALEGNYEEHTCKRMLGGKACGFKTGGETIPKKEHVYKDIQKYRAPTCKTNGQLGQKKCDGCGVIIYLDANGETANILTQNLTATGHVDSDGDMICEKCDALLEAEDLCTCICHDGENGGLMYFVVWILKWFWKLTNTNEMCACGKMHY